MKDSEFLPVTSEQETPEIAESAKPQSESKSKPGRKTKQKKSKKKPKRDSHACRPRSTISYWVEGIENGRFKGAELVLAIERVEAHEKDKERKKLEKSKPIAGSALRSILKRDPKASEPVPKIAEIAKSALNAKPQLEELPPAPEPEATEIIAEPASMTFDEMMQELAKQTKQIRDETSESIAKRLRDVPAPEPDAATRELITRAWSKAH